MNETEVNNKVDVVKYNTHGESGTRIYNIWNKMKSRCNNPNSINYSSYGGRGITVCQDWEESFESFRDWAHSNGYKDDLTIDRIDNDGDYEPSNCRWATYQEQAENTSRTIMIEYNGEIHTITEWSRISGIHVATLSSRYHSGDRGDRLFRATGNNGRSMEIEYNGETRILAEWGRITGLNVRTLSYRYHRGDRGDSLFRPVRK